MTALVAVVAPWSAVSAQTVTGTVREAETLSPLGLALVALVDTTGAQVATTVAGQDGRFALQAPVAGTYRLRARILGFDDATSEPFMIAASGFVRRDVLASVRVVQLAGIQASASKSCRSLSAAGPALATVWGEARTALETVAWTERTGTLVYHVSEFRRTLDESTLAVREANEDLRRASYTGSPYVSVPADTLLAHGYVRRGANGEGSWEYWAPDATVLLSDAFLDTHCFDVHPESDAERVGLLFEPVAERELPEVEGALWLDRSSSELRSLEFRYVNLPSAHPESPYLGGEVEFENLATGAWIVRSWQIRMPVMRLGMRPSGITQILDSFVEQGARVLRVGTVDGQTLADAVGATVTGIVRIGDGSQPLPGAELEIVSTDRGVVVGADGGYRLVGLPTGTFEVRVSHPWLDVLGAGAVSRTVALEEGRTSRLNVDVDLAGELGRFCPSVPDPRVVYGTLVDPGLEQPIGRVTVRVGEQASDVTDWMGRWAVCVDAGVESVSIAMLSADGEERARTVAALGDDPLVELPLRADAESFVDAPEPVESRLVEPVEEVLRGRVFEAGSEEPVAGAAVTLYTLTRSVVGQSESGPNGEFAIPAPSGTVYFLYVDKDRYSDLTLVGDLVSRTDSAARLDLQLYPAPIELEGIDVRVEGPSVAAQRGRLRLETGGFFDRAEMGFGDFITPEDIESQFAANVSDYLREIPGIRLYRGLVMFRDPGNTNLTAGDGNPLGLCLPNVWVDGVLTIKAADERVTEYYQDTERRETRLDATDFGQSLDDYLLPTDIAAIEVYRRPSSTPLMWSGLGNQCGTIVIWTR
jgi:hypothetical protein